MFLRTSFVATLTVGLFSPLLAQRSDPQPPVIDVHKHAPMRSGPIDDFRPDLGSWLATMDSMNVRLSVLHGVPDVLFAWRQAAGDRSCSARRS